MTLDIDITHKIVQLLLEGKREEAVTLCRTSGLTDADGIVSDLYSEIGPLLTQCKERATSLAAVAGLLFTILAATAIAGAIALMISVSDENNQHIQATAPRHYAGWLSTALGGGILAAVISAGVSGYNFVNIRLESWARRRCLRIWHDRRVARSS